MRAIRPVEPEDDYGDDEDYADDGADDGASGGGGLPWCKDAKRWRKNRSCPLWAALGECKANRAFGPKHRPSFGLGVETPDLGPLSPRDLAGSRG